MKKVIIGGIALGALGLFLKKLADSKASKEGYMDLGDYALDKGLDLFERVESSCKELSKKIDSYLENTDFSTLDSIDKLLGGKIENTLKSFEKCIDSANNFLDESVLGSSLHPLDKVGYALEVLVSTKDSQDYKQAKERFDSACREFERFKEQNKDWEKTYTNKPKSAESLESMLENLQCFEKNIDPILGGGNLKK